MANLDQLFVHKLNTTLTRDFQKLDLRLHKKVESHLRDEETRSRASRISDRRPDVEGGKIGGGIYGIKGATENGVEDVVDTGTTAELLCGNLSRGTVDGGNEGVGEACHLLENERASVLFSTKVHIPIAGQLLLSLAHKCVEPSLDVGQTFTDMAHESGVKGLGQVVSAASDGDVAVSRMMLEEICFSLEGILHRLVSQNILLRSVDHTDETKLQGVDAARKNVQSIGAMVHKVDLGQDTDGSSAKRVNVTGKLESFRVDDINIGRRHSENDTVGLGDVFGNEVSSLLLDIGGLVANRNLI